MMPPDPQLVTRIRRAITKEIYLAFGRPEQWWGRRFLDPILWLPAQRFAVRAAQFDQDVSGPGLSAAARNILQGFVENVCVHGAENVPEQGPVLLAGNHPGAYDGLAIMTGLRRKDIHLVVSGVDFTRSLPVTSQRLIYVTPDAGVRMKAVRECLRHLRAGGALLIFPTGLVDPDPSLWPEAAHQTLHGWSQSLSLMLRRAPETQLVITTTSHVVSKAAARSLLTRLVNEDWQRRRLAEYVQVIQQLVLRRQFHLLPRVSFAPPLSVQGVAPAAVPDLLLEKAQAALTLHLALETSAYRQTLS